MSASAFRRNDHPTLGVEVELALVDEATLELRSAIDDVLSALPIRLLDRAKCEFLQCYVELNTGVCRDVAAVHRDFSRTIRAVEIAASRAGVALFWGGTHPFSRWSAQALSPDPRYAELVADYREVVLRPVTFGLHVHVGVSTGDAAIAAMNRLAGQLPLLLALSANSPFWQGRVTGLHSHRIDVLQSIPTGGIPPALQGWRDYEALVESLTRSGLIKGPRELWWDVRPNPAFGTIEVRICDTPADLTTVLALSALIQCLVSEPGASRREFKRPSEAQRLATVQSRWHASRYGMDARLIDPESGLAVPVRDMARRLADRLQPTAESLGCEVELARVAEISQRPGGSERQLGLFAETGNLAEVVRRSVGLSRLRTSPPLLANPLGVHPLAPC
jgi:glutamate---cysteine ligase / carboxylate-amine ligase